MHCDPAHIVLRELDLACVHADADRDIESVQLIANSVSTVDRPRRTIKGGQETVAQGLHLLAAEPRKLFAHRLVMSLQKVVPTAITSASRSPTNRRKAASRSRIASRRLRN
jgi:hypothetical protein